MRDTTRESKTNENSSVRRRRSTRERGNNLDAGDLDIDSLLKDNDSSYDSDLESIFRRSTKNPFKAKEEILEANSSRQRELDDLAKSDNTKMFKTGYSIHRLSPYVLALSFICIGFVIIDMMFFNIIEFLSEDIRYKLPAYSLIVLFFTIFTYFFIKNLLEYYNFEMIVNKYKIIQSSKKTTIKNEIPYYSIQEFINDRGLFGKILNYGNFSIYLNTRRSIVFEKLHGAQYVYDMIQRLKYGNLEDIQEEDQISQMISGSDKIQKINKKREAEPDSLDLDVDFSGLGFSEDELREMGMSSSSLSNSSKTSRANRWESNSSTKNDSEMDALEDDSVEGDNSRDYRRRSSLSSRRTSRR